MATSINENQDYYMYHMTKNEALFMECPITNCDLCLVKMIYGKL